MSSSGALVLRQVLGPDEYLKLDRLQTIVKRYYYWFAADSWNGYVLCNAGTSKNLLTTILEAVYTHALNTRDCNTIDILQKEFGDDIEKDSEYFTNAIDETVRMCLKNDIVDGEYIAWLLKFKKQHFGFGDERMKL